MINKMEFLNLKYMGKESATSTVIWQMEKIAVITITLQNVSVLGVYWNQPVCPSVCPSVYKILISVKVLVRVLTLSQTSPGFYVSAVQVFLKTLWEKEKLLINEQFLLFPQSLLPIWKTLCHFRQIWKCHLQTLSVWKRLKFVAWERVKWHLVTALVGSRQQCTFSALFSWSTMFGKGNLTDLSTKKKKKKGWFLEGKWILDSIFKFEKYSFIIKA